MFSLSSLVAPVGSAAVVIVALGVGGLYLHHKGYVEGKAATQAVFDKYVSEQAEATTKLTTGIADDWAANLKAQNAKLDAANVATGVALRKLRDEKRSTARLAGTAGRACEGATGAELSRPDAGFLIGQVAARAERQRVALGACYERIDALQLRLNPKYVPPPYLPEPVDPSYLATPP